MLSFLQKTFGRRSGRRRMGVLSSPILAIESLNARLMLSAVTPTVGDVALTDAEVTSQASGETDSLDVTRSESFGEAGEHMYPTGTEMSYSDMSMSSMTNMNSMMSMGSMTSMNSMMAMSDFNSPANLVSLDEVDVMHELFANLPAVENGFQTVELQDEAGPVVSSTQKQPQSLQRTSVSIVTAPVDTVHFSDDENSTDPLTEDLLPEVISDSEFLELEVRDEQQTSETAMDRPPVLDSDITDQDDSVESTEPFDIALENSLDASLLDQLFLPGDIVEAIENQIVGTSF